MWLIFSYISPPREIFTVSIKYKVSMQQLWKHTETVLQERTCCIGNCPLVRLWMSFFLHLQHQGQAHLLHRLFTPNGLVQQRRMELDYLIFLLELPIAKASIFQNCIATQISPTSTYVFVLTLSCMQVDLPWVFPLINVLHN